MRSCSQGLWAVLIACVAMSLAITGFADDGPVDASLEFNLLFANGGNGGPGGGGSCKPKCSSGQVCLDGTCIGEPPGETCGNGSLDAGETCDNSTNGQKDKCPTSCPTVSACEPVSLLVGDPGQCNVSCETSIIDVVSCNDRGLCSTDKRGRSECICEDGYVSDGLTCRPVPDPCMVDDFIPWNFYVRKNHQCFFIHTEDATAVQAALEPTTGRVLLYGVNVAVDCPVTIVNECFERALFADTDQHEFQMSRLGLEPRLYFDRAENPSNLIYFGILEEGDYTPCPSASACAFDEFRVLFREDLFFPNDTRTSAYLEGDTAWFFDSSGETTCKSIAGHEYQHIIDRNVLPSHSSWFEEMIARTFWSSWEQQQLCPGLVYSNFRKVIDGVTTETSVQPSFELLNSELPFEGFGTKYANGDPCREAVIMQMSRDALDQGQSYDARLFSELMDNPIETDAEIALTMVLASDQPTEAYSFLEAAACF